MNDLTGQVAIITGASSGIGAAAARLFAAHGAKLVLNGRSTERLAAVAAEIEAAGGETTTVAGDLRNADLADALVMRAQERFGGVDIAFNNAGVVEAMGPIETVTLEAWRDSLEINLTSAFAAARAQAPAIAARGGGSIIFTASFVGYTAALAGMAAYAAAKAGLIGLAKCLAVEFADRGVRVNALLPGGVDTPMNLANAPDAPPETRSFIEGLHALKRIARPQEIAEAALFLASPRSSFVTGTAMLADGGVSISKG